MLYHQKPKDYITQMEVAACIIECNGEILLLQQAQHKNSPGKWLDPGGKREMGESPEETMIREVFEETGIVIQIGEAKVLFKKYFYHLEINIAIDFFYVTLESKAKVTISDEHSQYL